MCLNSFLTKTSDAVEVPSATAEQQLSNQVKLDFFLPVLDVVSSSLSTRFNAECASIIKHISLVRTMTENFDVAVRQLCSIVKSDGDLCMAEIRR